ncbi:uncharacterized protein B0J16DRAFT_358384 [Fusarium flagelliforme]|uniref:uncharacterized protein n=1 Tax=Fusarium flagelliforme TaxID=2675880 RepID=UPI001E8CB5F1|nr:uncharacterized protein B0J16DRAFT_358384 [Fusarium flagelliforme]KAH7175153.1 hypothetical protein B0J16DRAFT_358384 [Fusarium flagelliforme]
MLDGYTPEETIGDNLTVYGASIPSHPQRELSAQAYLPQDQFLFYGGSSSEDRWVDTYSTVKNQAPSPERLVAVDDEPPSTLTPSLQLSQELPKKPDRKTKTRLSERAAPKSAGRNARGDINTDDQRRKETLADGNGIHVSSGTTNRKQHAKHKRVQERNRIATNKCQMRKRDHLARLQSDEQAMEQRHMMLTNCVNDLKDEILYLKTQLFQHRSCSCTLIHHYIEKEAQRYTDALGLR